MDDIEALCSRVMIIDHGRIGFDGSLAALVHNAQPRKLVRAVYAEPVSPEVPPGVDATAIESNDPHVLSLEVAREDMGALLERLPGLGPLVDLGVADADVEDIVRDIFSGQREVQS
jgi:ABC-2 type transport system ATP-binding protein